jgi:hypothetical protein
MAERRVPMSEQEQLFKVLLEELQGFKTNMATELHRIKSNMATKKDIELINFKLDKLSGKIDAQHIENINADNRLLNDIQELKDGVLFVNRKNS